MCNTQVPIGIVHSPYFPQVNIPFLIHGSYLFSKDYFIKLLLMGPTNSLFNPLLISQNPPIVRKLISLGILMTDAAATPCRYITMLVGHTWDT